MKIGEAQKIYREERQNLIDQRKALINQRDELRKKSAYELVLQLGTRWAGVEFELRTDAGIFPVPVVVDEYGVLTMDLGGSTTYTLSCIHSTAPIPDPEPEQTDPPPPAVSDPVPEAPVSPQKERKQGGLPIPAVIFLVGLAVESPRSISQRSARNTPMTSGSMKKTSRNTDFALLYSL